MLADALSRRPRINAVTIAYHKDLTSMIDDYKSDPDFATIYEKVEQEHEVNPSLFSKGRVLDV